VFRAAQVEPSVDEHLEAEARAGEHLGRPHPAHAAVGEVHEADAGQLRHPPHQAAELLFLERTAEDSGM